MIEIINRDSFQDEEFKYSLIILLWFVDDY
jgi:hypothetical protein